MSRLFSITEVAPLGGQRDAEVALRRSAPRTRPVRLSDRPIRRGPGRRACTCAAAALRGGDVGDPQRMRGMRRRASLVPPRCRTSPRFVATSRTETSKKKRPAPPLMFPIAMYVPAAAHRPTTAPTSHTRIATADRQRPPRHQQRARARKQALPSASLPIRHRIRDVGRRPCTPVLMPEVPQSGAQEPNPPLPMAAFLIACYPRRGCCPGELQESFTRAKLEAKPTQCPVAER